MCIYCRPIAILASYQNFYGSSFSAKPAELSVSICAKYLLNEVTFVIIMLATRKSVGSLMAVNKLATIPVSGKGFVDCK